MLAELALKLVAIVEAYFSEDEFRELAALFDVDLTELTAHHISWLSVSRELISGLDHGNNRRLLDAVLDLASGRNSDGVAHTSWERQEFHRNLSSVISHAEEILAGSAAPSEVAVPAGSIFSAKSRVRELLATAEDEVLLVDPYVGVGTLDCLRDLAVPIRILTGIHLASIETGFEHAARDFSAEGYSLDIRRSSGLHDRHLVFNGRCWLIGGSLKDAGKKPFNCIEIVDKERLIADLETAWIAGTVYP